MKSAPMPKTVRILGTAVRIEELPKRKMGPGVYGLCYHAKERIEIAKGLGVGLKRGTLWHEIKHFINAELGVGDDTTEEDAVSRGSVGELAVLRDNPELTAFLLDP